LIANAAYPRGTTPRPDGVEPDCAFVSRRAVEKEAPMKILIRITNKQIFIGRSTLSVGAERL